MTKTLIVGAHTGGIGDELAAVWRESNDVWPDGTDNELFAPTIDELDVTRPVSMRFYLSLHGPFDEIVYAAGVNILASVDDLNYDILDRTFAVNTFGLPLLLGAHLNQFPLAEGRAVQVISDAAHTPMRQSLAYCASKAAAEMALKVMARELHPSWTLVGVNPGVVEGTAMTDDIEKHVMEARGWTQEAAQAYETANSVLGRRVEKHEVANLLWYALRGPEALNGSIITINGKGY